MKWIIVVKIQLRWKKRNEFCDLCCLNEKIDEWWWSLERQKWIDSMWIFVLSVDMWMRSSQHERCSSKRRNNVDLIIGGIYLNIERCFVKESIWSQWEDLWSNVSHLFFALIFTSINDWHLQQIISTSFSFLFFSFLFFQRTSPNKDLHHFIFIHSNNKSSIHISPSPNRWTRKSINFPFLSFFIKEVNEGRFVICYLLKIKPWENSLSTHWDTERDREREGDVHLHTSTKTKMKTKTKTKRERMFLFSLSFFRIYFSGDEKRDDREWDDQRRLFFSIRSETSSKSDIQSEHRGNLSWNWMTKVSSLKRFVFILLNRSIDKSTMKW